ncbi:MAG: hypothetical protein RBR42_10865 [Desulfomicrobium sp.]|nr:hypothetical protein [Desulfomicrobium sp.]NLV97866.1 hypothetical protein [Desulfovibrionales bacterium]
MSKHLAFLLFILLLVSLFAQPGLAQQSQAQPAKRTILDYQQELQLNQNQIKSIQDHWAKFESRVQDLQQQIGEIEQKISASLEKEMRLTKDIEKLIRKSFELRADLRIADLDTGTKINSTLSTEQFQKWIALRRAGLTQPPAANQ